MRERQGKRKKIGKKERKKERRSGERLRKRERERKREKRATFCRGGQVLRSRNPGIAG